MKAIRQLFLANWRNKGVALFFALSIWFVAYQSETREFPDTLVVELRSAEPEKMVIVSTQAEGQGDVLAAFGGHVRVVFTGPRKQIERLKDRPKRRHFLTIGAEADRHEFDQEDFGFPRDSVGIRTFEPQVIRIRQEALVTWEIEDLRDRIVVTQVPEGYDIVKEIIEPRPPRVRLRGPVSLKERAVVGVTVPLRYKAEVVNDSFALDVRPVQPEEEILVKDLVEIWDPSKRSWVSTDDPIHVHLRVQPRAREREETFAHEAVRVMFRAPISGAALRYSLDGMPGDRIPVVFSGPKDQIDALRRRVTDSDFGLVVPPPAQFDPAAGGGTFTFSEDSLELYGFPGVTVKQHPKRKEELKTLFSYKIETFSENGEGDG